MPQRTWIDKHSINCCLCENLIDEREAMQIIGGGSYCEEHHKWVVGRLKELCKHLEQATEHRICLDDNTTELNDLDDGCLTVVGLDDAVEELRQALNGELPEQPTYVNITAYTVWQDLKLLAY